MNTIRKPLDAVYVFRLGAVPKMLTRRILRNGIAVCAVLAGLATAGCDVSVQRTLDADAVAQKAAHALAREVGKKPDSVTCPTDLTVKKGASIRCTLVGNGVPYGLTVTVESIDGDNVHLDFQVDQQPLPQSQRSTG